jgi:hypothetical protein
LQILGHATCAERFHQCTGFPTPELTFTRKQLKDKSYRGNVLLTEAPYVEFAVGRLPLHKRIWNDYRDYSGKEITQEAKLILSPGLRSIPQQQKHHTLPLR